MLRTPTFNRLVDVARSICKRGYVLAVFSTVKKKQQQKPKKKKPNQANHILETTTHLYTTLQGNEPP
jgi:hypothetical protein